MKKLIFVFFGIFLFLFLIWFVGDRFSLMSGSRINLGELRQVDQVMNVETNNKNVDLVTEVVDWKLEEVASDLFVPWSIVFTDSQRVLVSERSGQVREVVNGELNPKSLLELDVSQESEEGLMGMVLDPNYDSNKYIYGCYAYEREGNLVDRVVKLKDDGNTLTEEEVVIDQIPAAKFHAGCRLGFGPDDKLYITTGDATDKELAQDMSSLAGKILRVNVDGSIPEDNPDSNSAIFSSGHRNPQGIDWHPETNKLYSSEHGPSVFDGPAGGDEINLIEAGNNYGWPLVSHDESLDGTEPPLIQFTPAEAPGSLLVYSGKVFEQYRDDLFMGALKGEGIVRVRLKGDGRTVEEVEKLSIDVGRVREVMEGPDGYIYFTTSNRDGRGELNDGDDKVYRLVPKEL